MQSAFSRKMLPYTLRVRRSARFVTREFFFGIIIVVFWVKAGELTPTQVLLVFPMVLYPESHAKHAKTFSIHRVCTRYALSIFLNGAL